MKPLLMRHSEPRNEAFKIWYNGQPYLHNPWHYHPEFEITFIKNGEGLLFIGDKIVDYTHNDIFLIGPNLPHEWRSNIKEDPDSISESYSIHFDTGFLGQDFFNLSETWKLQKLFVQADNGIKLAHSIARGEIGDMIASLIFKTDLSKISGLLQIFDYLLTCKIISPITSEGFAATIKNSDERLRNIFSYVMKNFTNPLTIEDAAAIVNLTPTSFCRFFKSRTHKSFVNYLHDIRVGYACKLLQEEKYTISQVAYHCGFENLSNFNKQFKKIKGSTPKEYFRTFKNK